MFSLLEGRRSSDRDREFATWAETRRARLAAAARSRRLRGLVIRCGGVTDTVLAPLLPVGFEERAGHRISGGFLVLGDKAWGFRPDSPWEVEESRSLGLPTLDPRHCDACPTKIWAAVSARGELDEVARIGVIGFETGTPDAETEDPPQQAAEGVHVIQLGLGFVLDRLRRPSPMECAEVDRVCRANDLAQRAVARRLVEAVASDGALWLAGRPLTIGRLRRAAIRAVERSGLSFPEGCLVSAGSAAARPHDHGDDTARVREGEPIVVDLFPRGALFSDMTRTFVAGGVNRAVMGGGDLARALASVERGLEMAEQAVIEASKGQQDVSAHRVQQQVDEFFRTAEWPVPRRSAGDGDGSADEGFVHGLGHGVGYRLHQAPWFSAEEADTEAGRIGPGEAFTLEPGLYRPGSWGVRIEDVYRLEPMAERDGEPVESVASRASQQRAELASDAALRLVRLTRAPRSSDPARFLYEFARER